MKFTSAAAILGSMVAFLHGHVMAAPQDQMRDLIIGGRDANPGEFPFFAAGVGCGGTLIHEDIVLTAGHCQDGGTSPFDFYVQIGGTTSSGRNDIMDLDGEIIPTVCVVNHPDYKGYASGYDVALVKLARPSAGPLIELNFDPTFPEVGQTVTAIGYGITSYGTPIAEQTTPPKYADTLQVLSPLYIQSEEVCNFVDPEEYRADFHLCVDDNDPVTTACRGDSGGPIFTENMVQVGISSFGLKKGITEECYGDKPDYWTSVAKHESFIKRGICGKWSSLISLASLNISFMCAMFRLFV
jgi:secreted trypsin-like serine protease